MLKEEGKERQITLIVFIKKKRCNHHTLDRETASLGWRQNVRVLDHLGDGLQDLHGGHVANHGHRLHPQLYSDGHNSMELGDLLLDLPRAAMAVHRHLEGHGLGLHMRTCLGLLIDMEIRHGHDPILIPVAPQQPVPLVVVLVFLQAGARRGTRQTTQSFLQTHR